MGDEGDRFKSGMGQFGHGFLEQAVEELVAWRSAPPQRRTLVQALFRHWGRLRRR